MATELIVAKFTDKGAPATGLSATIRIWRLDTDVLVVTDAAMTEVAGGVYKYSFATYDETLEYAYRCDGGATLKDYERYVYGTNEARFVADKIEDNIRGADDDDLKDLSDEIATRAAPGDQMNLADDAITSAKYDETTAYPLAQADTGASEVARTGADADTLESLSDQLDAKAEPGDAMDLVANAVDATAVATGAIDADAIAANAITATKIASGAITAAKIASAAITATKIAADAIGSSELATSAVNEIRDAILADSTPFNGADIDAAISSRAAQSDLESVAFGDAVYIDQLYGSPGTSWPRGTPFDPVDSLADALTIAASVGVRKFVLRNGSFLQFTSSMSDYVFEGEDFQTAGIVVGGQNVGGSVFRRLSIYGDQANSGATYEDCLIWSHPVYPILNMSGYFVRCGFVPTTSAYGVVGVSILDNCHARISGVDDVAFDGNGEIYAYHWSGSVDFQNRTSGAVEMFVDSAGLISLASSVTGGLFSISGATRIYNGGTATINRLAALNYPDLNDYLENDASHGAGSWQSATVSPSAVATAVWSEALPGAFGAGEAGYILGTNLDVLVSSRATQADILSDATPFAGANLDAAISSRSSHTAADVDTQLSGVHGAGSWEGTSPAAIWGEALPGAYGAGSAGYILGTNLDALITSRSSHDASDVDTQLSGVHGSGSWEGDTAATITAAVWGEALPGLFGAGTAGYILGTNLDDQITDVVAAIGALNDLDQAGVQAAMTAQGYTAGRASGLDNLDALISSRSSHSAADVDTQLSGVHGAGSWEGDSAATIDALLTANHGAGSWQSATVSPAAIAAAVWQEPFAGYTTDTEMGYLVNKYLRALIEGDAYQDQADNQWVILDPDDGLLGGSTELARHDTLSADGSPTNTHVYTRRKVP